MQEEIKDIVEEQISHSKSKMWIFLSIGGVACVLLLSALFVYAKSYEQSTIPGLVIQDISLGKMNRQEIEEFLNTMSDKLVNDGIEFQVQHSTGTASFTVLPNLATDAIAVDYISIDTQKETNRLLQYKKEGNFLFDAINIFLSYAVPEEVTLQHIQVDKERLKDALREKARMYEAPPRNASIHFQSFDPLLYTFTTSAPGFTFHYDAAIDEVASNWKHLRNTTVLLRSEKTEPGVKESDFSGFISTLPTYFDLGPLVLQYLGEEEKLQEWKIPVKTFAQWLTVQKDGQDSLVLSLDSASTTLYLEKFVAPDITVEAQNAKFDMSPSGKVQEFQAAKVGRGVDFEKTVAAIQSSFFERSKTTTSSVQIIISETEPEISTADVNDLGIKEVLGVGFSNFGGSPSNRIKNIRNAVIKLNGTLIKPGDEFSAIKYTEPYTLEGGYFPEKVIKGDEIKPEIGGGLCQVGTTLFRMAMNSGMEITERRSHSLAVSYYNDPSNGLPGTDATIYDPSPDFRFKNDTEHYILIQTSINEKTGDLYFTIWGTKDGRKGSYSKPVVHKKIPTGPARIIETTNLAPGKRECQHAFPGASASFTYTRIMPDGTTQDRVFESYYRPLPEICLVGVEKASEPTTPVPDSIPVADKPVELPLVPTLN